LISVCTLDEFKKHVRSTFKRAEAGKEAEEPIHKLYFPDEDTLFGTLSRKRMELLRYLKKHGPLSIRQLAAQLDRAYANVHDDVKQLLQLELVVKNEEEKLVVPWDEINIAVSLAA